MATIEKYGLYVHMPFCIKKCDYCDFLSFSQWDKNLVDLYSERLIAEILSLNRDAIELDTIYFGGGTPSAISPIVINRIVESIERRFIVARDAERTIEINPATSLQASIAQYHEMGFNRVSIGLQSGQNRLLKLLGRAHDVQDFLTTYRILSDTGFENLSVDVMYGLPEQRLSDLMQTIDLITDLKNVQHISAYSLIIEEDTAMARKVQKGHLLLPKEEAERKAHYLLRAELAKRGFAQYEISNYARPGYESKHNSGYWQLKPYYGVGLGAASFVDGVRYRTETDMEAYLKVGSVPDRKAEWFMTEQELMEDYVMLGLRMTEGIQMNQFQEKFLTEFDEVFGLQVTELLDDGFLRLEENRLALTEKGQDFENYVNLALMSAKGESE